MPLFSIFRKGKDQLEILEEKEGIYSEIVSELNSEHFSKLKMLIENYLAKQIIHLSRIKNYEEFVEARANQFALERLLGIEAIANQDLKMLGKRIKELKEQRNDYSNDK